MIQNIITNDGNIHQLSPIFTIQLSVETTCQALNNGVSINVFETFIEVHFFLLSLSLIQTRAVLTKIFQLTSITKNLNDAHELLTSMKMAAILFFEVSIPLASAISS